MTYVLTSTLPDDARLIRQTVFVEEQGFCEEFDETDAIARHLVVYVDGHPAATGRLFAADEPGEWIIGRVAVMKSYRGHDWGRTVLALLEEEARRLGASRLRLDAQCRAEGFYTRCGYTAVGQPFDEEGCPHIRMVRHLADAQPPLAR